MPIEESLDDVPITHEWLDTLSGAVGFVEEEDDLETRPMTVAEMDCMQRELDAIRAEFARLMERVTDDVLRQRLWEARNDALARWTTVLWRRSEAA